MSDQEKNGTTEENAVDSAEEQTEEAQATAVAPAAEDAASAEEAPEFEFVEPPSFELDYKGDCAYEVKVTIAPANEKKQAEELLGDLQKEATLPGFRPGRAPRKLVEKKFGKAVKADATEKLVSAAFQKLIKEKDLKPIEMPDIQGLEDTLERGEDEPLTCTFSFEVAPRCELGEYKGIEVERPVLEVNDDDIENALNDTRERFASYEEVEDSPAEEGDQVVIDFKGTIDGEEFQGGSAEDYPYILGSQRFFGEFEEVLQGARAGEEKSCEVAFPEDYGSEEIAGKTANFDISVKEVRRRKLPELDDEFAKMMGADDMDALRQQVADRLRQGAETQSRNAVEQHAMAKIIEGSTFELPQSLLKSVADEYFSQEVRRLASLRVPGNVIEEREEEIREEARGNAERELKEFVALNKIGEAEGIEVTEADFEREAEAIQERTGAEMETVRRFMQQTDQQDEYESRILRRKAMDFLLENANITDREVPAEELEEETDETES